MTTFDWPALMTVGLAGLRLRPDEFWALTPAEFLVLTGRTGGAGAATRESLERLVHAFPDERKNR